jgi:hypothetical protein
MRQPVAEFLGSLVLAGGCAALVLIGALYSDVGPAAVGLPRTT